ncbi:hypothetical protein PQX77_008926 [Marasmius sp. AFHP31]|nr:hypothetical protein PQX77_008926 [Marasmius sp. AFHP31]
MEPTRQSDAPALRVTTPPQSDYIARSNTETAPPRISIRGTKFSVDSPTPWNRKRVEVALHTAGRHYGPMRVEEFFKEFMPLHKERSKPPQKRLNLLKGMALKETEPEMYPVFVDALKGWPYNDGGRQVKLEYHDNHSIGDPNCADLAVDVAVGDASTSPFWRKGHHIPFAEHESHVEFKTSTQCDPYDDREYTRQARQSQDTEIQEEEQGEIQEEDEEIQEEDEEIQEKDEYADIDVPLPLPDSDNNTQPTSEEEENGFMQWHTEDSKYKFENSSNDGINCRGQLGYYAAAALTAQYRTHFFQLVILRCCARIIRWDRSSAIATQRFDYTKEPELIFEFYERLANLDRAGRGYDPYVTRASKSEAAAARKKLASFLPDGWHGRTDYPQKLHRDIKSQAFLKLETDDGSKFIIPSPVFYPDCYSPFGRSTRRCLAYNLAAREICFSKDYFAQHYTTTLKEADVYRRIQEKREEKSSVDPVPFGLCTMIAGGDVPGTQTRGHEYWQAPWIIGKPQEPVRLIGHRIFLVEVGASIRTFPNFKTVLTCAGDAMEAHSWLLKVLHILHRDLSPGNIIMKREPEHGSSVRRGYLIDFDHAFDLTRTCDSLSPGRSGTFPFFSIDLLENPQARQTAMDDRESCFYSIVWLGMLHLKHSQSSNAVKLHENLTALFTSMDSSSKLGYMLSEMFSRYGWQVEGLAELLAELEDVFSWRYRPTLRVRSQTLSDALAAEKAVAMKLLDDPDWMHQVIRTHVNNMPEPTGKEFILNRHWPSGASQSEQKASLTMDTNQRMALDGHLNSVGR